MGRIQREQREKSKEKLIYRWSELEAATTSVPDSWLAGYIHGNSMWPQVATGFCLLSLAQAVQELPKTGTHLLQSRLNEQQILALRRTMSALHHGQGIQVAAAEHAQAHDRIIGDLWFHDLWRVAKVYIANAFFHYSYSESDWGRFSDGDMVQSDRLETLDRIFHSKSFRNQVATMQAVMDIVTKTFESEEAKTLATLYRFQFNQNPHELQTLSLVQKYSGSRGKAITGLDEFKGTGFLGEFHSLVRKNLAQRFPGHSFPWLFPPTLL